jgi:hypothetical protein
MNGNDPPEVLVSTPANEYGGAVSPDGRWLAYQSDETGRPEVFVRDFTGRTGARWQVTSSGGEEPFTPVVRRNLQFRNRIRPQLRCGPEDGQVSSRESRYDGPGRGAGDSELGFRSQPELKAAMITISGS